MGKYEALNGKTTSTASLPSAAEQIKTGASSGFYFFILRLRPADSRSKV
jgi:hypothetical protein